ncbi:fimbria/pilus periplasmic chaperone [Paraburkholderia sp. CNPSo 3281]|uniref:fimbria/pilus periplasmic chaperone n=1 Tax=Paraburkholderia sp. CNPSo 3281 TaxID=2940933 RepID=UPI0020B76B1F|nr:fimbria/pilus periplasmic chaperone [Paraburkholderia sp. CNPSo 3281]MCP3717686.1 fimbria/pilus periplasmic chaperone [Paraburkholderia sp. CNPSo 3281]
MKANRVLKALVAAAFAAVSLAASTNSHASVVLAGTRVIYNQREPEVTLKLSNVGQSPALVQVWIDKGDPKAMPSTIEVPFTITPPIARIDPGKGQTLRIIYTGEPLATDHESVFWLNVLEIPPRPTGDAADINKLQLAFRSRIKLFFRPEALKADPQQAAEQMTWRLVADHGKNALQVSNPSQYHVSLTGAELQDGASKATLADGAMIAPGETASLPLAGSVSGSAAAKVRYHVLNDYGGNVDGEAPLLQGPAPALSRMAAPAAP